MANNTIVISRIQNRRGRRENLPQPLLPGEFALTADTDQVWIGGDPTLAVPSIKVYRDKLQSNAQDIIDNNIAEAKFTEDFTSVDFTTLVSQLLLDAVVTLTDQDILFDDTYRGTILTITVDSVGTGYTTGDTVTATSPTGSGFVGFVVDNGGGGIASVTITSGGQNYLASNTTFNIAGGTGGALSVDEFDIHGYSVFIAADDDVDPDNTIVNVATAVAATGPGGLSGISTTALGGTFTSNLLIMDTQDEASAVATLINRVNASTPGQTTGLVHTTLNVEVTGGDDFSLLSEVLNLFSATITTVNATQTTLQTLVIEDDFQNLIIARVKGYEEATGDTIWKYIRALVKNEAGVVSFVGSLSSDFGFDPGAAAWDITMTASGNTVLIQVTGEAATTIDWETVTEVSYAIDDSVLAPIVPAHSHTLAALTDVNVGSPGAPEDGYVLTWDNGTGFYVLAAPTDTPAGADTQVQYNDGGAFGGDADFTWNETTNTLTIGNAAGTGTLRAPASLNLRSGAQAGEGMDIQVLAADGTTNNGGQAHLYAGNSTDGAGGTADIVGGSSTNGNGGYVTIFAGNSTNAIAGNVEVYAGTGTTNGDFYISVAGVDSLRISGANQSWEIASDVGTPGYILKSDGTNGPPYWDPQHSEATIQTVGVPPASFNYTVGTNLSKLYEIKVIGREAATGDTYWKHITVGVSDVAGTASIVGSPVESFGNSAGAAAWSIVVSVSLGVLLVTVTGEAGKTVDWTARSEEVG